MARRSSTVLASSSNPMFRGSGIWVGWEICCGAAEVPVREEGDRPKAAIYRARKRFHPTFPSRSAGYGEGLGGGGPRWAVGVAGSSVSSGKRAASMVSEWERYRCRVAGGDKRGDEW
jgi:hypothetical protein